MSEGNRTVGVLGLPELALAFTQSGVRVYDHSELRALNEELKATEKDRQSAPVALIVLDSKQPALRAWLKQKVSNNFPVAIFRQENGPGLEVAGAVDIRPGSSVGEVAAALNITGPLSHSNDRLAADGSIAGGTATSTVAAPVATVLEEFDGFDELPAAQSVLVPAFTAPDAFDDLLTAPRTEAPATRFPSAAIPNFAAPAQPAVAEYDPWEEQLSAETPAVVTSIRSGYQVPATPAEVVDPWQDAEDAKARQAAASQAKVYLPEAVEAQLANIALGPSSGVLAAGVRDDAPAVPDTAAPIVNVPLTVPEAPAVVEVPLDVAAEASGPEALRPIVPIMMPEVDVQEAPATPEPVYVRPTPAATVPAPAVVAAPVAAQAPVVTAAPAPVVVPVPAAVIVANPEPAAEDDEEEFWVDEGDMEEFGEEPAAPVYVEPAAVIAPAPAEPAVVEPPAPARVEPVVQMPAAAPIHIEPIAAEPPAPVFVAPVVQEPVVVSPPAPVFVAPVVAEQPAPVAVAPVHIEPPAPVFVAPVVQEQPAPVYQAPAPVAPVAAEQPAPVYQAPAPAQQVQDWNPPLEDTAPVFTAPAFEPPVEDHLIFGNQASEQPLSQHQAPVYQEPEYQAPTPPAPAFVRPGGEVAIRPRGTIVRNASRPCIYSIGAKGGIGKTTTALLLAEYAVSKGLIVAVVDANRGQGDMRTILRLRDTNLPTIRQVAMGASAGSVILSPDTINSHRDTATTGGIGFALVQAPEGDRESVSMVGVHHYIEVVNELRSRADLTIVDTQIVEADDTSDLFDDMVIPALVTDANAYCLAVTDSAMTSMNNTVDRMAAFLGEHVKKDKIMVVLNRVTVDEEPRVNNMLMALTPVGTPMGMIPNEPMMKAAMDRGIIPDVTHIESLAIVYDRILFHATGDERFAPRAEAEAKVRRMARAFSFFKK